MEQVTAVRDSRDFELALRDESIEHHAERGRAELVPEDPHVLVVPRVERAGADPTRRPLRRKQPLPTGEVVDTGVQNVRELFPLVSWNVVERRHEAVTVWAGPDATARPAPPQPRLGGTYGIVSIVPWARS